MTFEVAKSRNVEEEWRVEAIDVESDGDVYVALFSGPEARQRAEEYAAFKNNKGTADGSARADRHEQQALVYAERLEAESAERYKAEAEIARLSLQLHEAQQALQLFAPGSHDGVWGRIKAFIVNGAPTRDEGIKIARQITEWQVAIPASAYVERDGDDCREARDNTPSKGPFTL